MTSQIHNNISNNRHLFTSLLTSRCHVTQYLSTESGPCQMADCSASHTDMVSWQGDFQSSTNVDTLPTTWESRYQNVSILDFIGAEDDAVGGDHWSCKTCDATVKMSPPTNQHPAFYRPDALLSLHQQC